MLTRSGLAGKDFLSLPLFFFPFFPFFFLPNCREPPASAMEAARGAPVEGGREREKGLDHRVNHERMDRMMERGRDDRGERERDRGGDRERERGRGERERDRGDRDDRGYRERAERDRDDRGDRYRERERDRGDRERDRR
jgi:hypothetical protein